MEQHQSVAEPGFARHGADRHPADAIAAGDGKSSLQDLFAAEVLRNAFPAHGLLITAFIDHLVNIGYLLFTSWSISRMAGFLSRLKNSCRRPGHRPCQAPTAPRLQVLQSPLSELAPPQVGSRHSNSSSKQYLMTAVSPT